MLVPLPPGLASLPPIVILLPVRILETDVLLPVQTLETDVVLLPQVLEEEDSDLRRPTRLARARAP
jgi:hypothetical protein